MSKNNSSKIVPVRCIKTGCQMAEVLIFDPAQKWCQNCTGELVPIPDYYKPSPTGPRTLPTTPLGGGYGVITTAKELKTNDTFVCPDDLKGCPIAKQPEVHIPLKLYNQWVFLADQIPTEWIAYLKGRSPSPGVYVIESMYFPPQKATGTHCEAVTSPETVQEGTIAAVHSHVSMNAFFSGEDVAHFNHPIELVVNDKGELRANGRSQLECGRWHRGEAKVLFTECEEEQQLIETLEKAITKDTTQFEVKPNGIRIVEEPTMFFPFNEYV